MDELAKQVRRAQRRLTVQRFLGLLGWCWTAGLAVALALVVIDRFYPLGMTPWGWAAGVLATGTAVAAVWALVARQPPLQAAIEIDRRFALKERVSSSLALTPDERGGEAGQALIEDARRRVSRIDVPSKFAVAPGPRLLLPLAPGVLLVLVAVLVSPAAVRQTPVGPVEPALAKKDVKKSTQALSRRLEERRKQAEKQGLEDAQRLFKKLEEGAREMAANPGERKKELVKLNDLSRELQQRRQQLGGAEKIKQQLDNLQKVSSGPADKFAKALSHGDFKQAAEELKKIKEQLADGKLSEKQQEEFARQLDQMQEKLQRLADAQQAAQKDLQKRIDQARRDGQKADADRLQEQLAQLQQQGPQMDQLKDLASKLGKCAKCLREGQTQEAESALSGVQQQVDKLRKEMDELEMLDGAMDQLAKTRDQMNCPHCNGQGCAHCQGDGQGDEPGDGLGRGRGTGARPEQKTDTAFYDSQVKQKVGQGSAAVVDMVDGPNVKGNVETQIQQQVESARHGSTDPLTGHQLPRSHRDHAREYFDRFREGKVE